MQDERDSDTDSDTGSWHQPYMLTRAVNVMSFYKCIRKWNEKNIEVKEDKKKTLVMVLKCYDMQFNKATLRTADQFLVQ